MLIGIDGNEANVKQRVGVHQYAWELLQALSKLETKHQFVVYLKSSPLADMPSETKDFKYKILSGGKVWNLTRLTPHLLAGERPDVFFTPSHYLPPILTVPSVMTIHDLKFLEFSGQFKKYDYWQLKLWTAKSVSISKAIIAVSNSTKQEIVRHYPAAAKKIHVVYHGYDKKRFNSKIPPAKVAAVKKKYGVSGDYLLFLGMLKPSKNVERLIVAFSKLSGDCQLVIAGKKGWLYEEIFKKTQELGLKERVIFTDFLPEKDKPALMAGARLLVSPSLTEGFGMHVIEAMACGTPVVVSKIKALEEVAGKATVFVDPEDTDDIAQGMGKVLGLSKKGYNGLVKKGVNQASKFSWEKSAQETLAVFEEVAE